MAAIAAYLPNLISSQDALSTTNSCATQMNSQGGLGLWPIVDQSQRQNVFPIPINDQPENAANLCKASCCQANQDQEYACELAFINFRPEDSGDDNTALCFHYLCTSPYSGNWECAFDRERPQLMYDSEMNGVPSFEGASWIFAGFDGLMEEDPTGNRIATYAKKELESRNQQQQQQQQQKQAETVEKKNSEKSSKNENGEAPLDPKQTRSVVANVQEQISEGPNGVTRTQVISSDNNGSFDDNGAGILLRFFQNLPTSIGIGNAPMVGNNVPMNVMPGLPPATNPLAFEVGKVEGEIEQKTFDDKKASTWRLKVLTPLIVVAMVLVLAVSTIAFKYKRLQKTIKFDGVKEADYYTKLDPADMAAEQEAQALINGTYDI